MPGFGQHVGTLERWRRFPGLERGDAGVVLTFDDGPDPDATPAVLDALDGAPATFFMLGEQVEAHPELALEVAGRGHEIGLHGHRHVEHDELGGEAGPDLARGLAALAAAGLPRPRLYRPPYGRFNEASYAACAAERLRPVYWSAWGEDWEELAPDRIADLVTRDLAPGAIVLLHDSARYAYRPSAEPTAAALPAILAAAASDGYDVLPL